MQDVSVSSPLALSAPTGAMADTTEFNRGTSFSDVQAAQPTTPLPGNAVDAEFDRVKLAMDSTQQSLDLIQRDDGALATASVGFDQIQPGLLAGLDPTTVWTTGVKYVKNNTVFYNDGTTFGLYRCLISHTSSDFETELAAGNWIFLADYTPPDLTGTVAVANGGTGATTASQARANLGLGAVSVENVLPATKGGTGATSISAARAALGLAIGVNVAAYDADLPSGSAIQASLAALREDIDNVSDPVVTAGSGNAYSVAPSDPIDAYEDKIPVSLIADRANTDAVTLDAGPGPLPVRIRTGASTFRELVAGEWGAFEEHLVVCRTTFWELRTQPLKTLTDAINAAQVAAQNYADSLPRGVPDAVIKYVEPADTSGGTIATSFAALTLNTEAISGNDVTLSGNQITLAAGTYFARFSVAFFNETSGPRSGFARLRNVTQAATAVVGTPVRFVGNQQAFSEGVGQFVAAQNDVFEMQGVASGTSVVNGARANFGEVQTYTTIEFWKTG